MSLTSQQLLRQVRESRLQFKTRQQLWHHYLSLVQPGDVLAEFGVWKGSSINYMARVRPDNIFHGFDSFQGLPEEWIKNHPVGHFRVRDKDALKWMSNIAIHDGLFRTTMPRFKRDYWQDVERLRFLHIDCDLGSSAEQVLFEFAETIVENKAWLLFDEFYGYQGYEEHEFQAFIDFVNHHDIKFHVEARNVRHQQVLIQIV